MELKAGYKQTDVGVIPEDWEECHLSEAVDFLDGQRRPIKSSERAKVSGTYPYYGASGIIDYVNDYIFDDKLILLGEDGENILSRNLPLVFQVNGKIWVNNHAHVLKPKENFDICFLTNYLENLDYSLLNSGTAQPKLNKNTCLKIKIAKPTKKEQTAIATALSDTDALISSLEKLITKKRNIKQRAMQTLLQPKEGWEVKKLGDVCELITKGTTPTSIGSDFKNEGINFIKIESLQKNGKIIQDKVAFIDLYTHNLLKRSQLKSNDILFSIAGALGRVAIVENNILPANTNQALSIIRLNNKETLYFKFVYYFLNNEKIQTHIQSISVQGAQANLSLLNIFNFQIEFPSYEEQTQIATILSDMDTEITTLETKLTKIKAIKLGMMQNLLTGKIRLI